MSYGSMWAGIGSGVGIGVSTAISERKAAAAGQAANEAAKKAALEEEQKAYDLESGKMKPWEEFGDKSRLSFQDLFGYNGPDAQAAALKSLQESTGYKARIQATERGAAARGGLYSGRAGLALQEAASSEYDKEYGRRYGLAKDAYGISTDAANRGAGYYRNRRDILNQSLLRGGEIQMGKWKGYGAGARAGFQQSASGFGGDFSGSGKTTDKKEDEKEE